MTFSASEAAFEGFRIVRRRPLAVLAWALAYIAFFGVGFLIVGKPVIAMMQQVEVLEGVAQPTMAQVAPMLQGYGLILGVIWPLSMVLSAMLSTAIARSVLQPKNSRFGYLRLGKDELRVLGATIVLFVLLGVYYFVAAMVCVMLGVAAHLTGQGWLWIFVVLAVFAALGGLIWLAVRLSLLVPLTLAENRFSLFGSFALTKGRFWPLLGMAVLAVVMAIVVSLLGMIIGLPLRLSLMGPFAEVASSGDIWPLIQQHIGLIIAWVIINALLSALQVAIMQAPFAAAYRDIKGLATV